MVSPASNFYVLVLAIQALIILLINFPLFQCCIHLDELNRSRRGAWWEWERGSGPGAPGDQRGAGGTLSDSGRGCGRGPWCCAHQLTGRETTHAPTRWLPGRPAWPCLCSLQHVSTHYSLPGNFIKSSYGFIHSKLEYYLSWPVETGGVCLELVTSTCKWFRLVTYQSKLVKTCRKPDKTGWISHKLENSNYNWIVLLGTGC